MNKYLDRIKSIVQDKISNETLAKTWILKEENFDELFYSDIKTDDILSSIEDKEFGGAPAVSDEDLKELVRELWNEVFGIKKGNTVVKPSVVQKKRTLAHKPITSKISFSNFIIKKTILSYPVVDYDKMCHSIAASERFPFIKLTSRKG